MRTAILKGVDTVQLKQHALEQGMTMLYDDGIQKALAGMTSLEEIARVTAEM